VLSVSSKVMFPELPTQNGYAQRSLSPSAAQTNFQNHRRPPPSVNAKTVKSSTRKGNGRGDDAPRPFRTTASDVYSAAEVQRKPNETVGL